MRPDLGRGIISVFKEKDTADVPPLVLRAPGRIRSLFLKEGIKGDLKGGLGWYIKSTTTKINLYNNSATHTITISVRSALKLQN